MNPLLVVVLVVGAVATLPAQTTQDVLATAAATLFEGTPFILAAAALAHWLQPRHHWLIPLLGCGCSQGPSARSLPSAVATWLAFGPTVALARLGAATAIGFLPPFRAGVAAPSHPGYPNYLSMLYGLLPFGLAAGVISHVLPWLLIPSNGLAGPWTGAFLGFALAPCGLGTVGVAGALRAASPGMLAGFLCVAGILDVRSFRSRHDHVRMGHNGLAYALSSLACAIAAAHGGAALVHPRFTLALWACAGVMLAFAIAHRHAHDPRALAAPALMFAIALCGAPPPTYRATATTLADAFPGERLSFTGALARGGSSVALVRYAITCCRADAAPIVVRLTRDVGARTGSWLRAEGRLESHGGSLQLNVASTSPMPPPADPYVYR